jgi:hypothetical protein
MVGLHIDNRNPINKCSLLSRSDIIAAIQIEELGSENGVIVQFLCQKN